jgi:hypothetical protein
LNIYLIGAYQNKEGDIILIPTKQEKGIRVEVNNIFQINASLNSEKLGAELREVFEFCKNVPSDYPKINYKESIKGYKSYKKFTQKWKTLNAVWRPEDEDYVFRPQKREQRGGYSGIGEAYNYPLDASNSELGQALLEAFKRCQ